MRWQEDFKFRHAKDPEEKWDITCKFAGLLQSDTIDTATVTSEQLTISNSSTSGNNVTFFVSGGTKCKKATIKVKILTNNVVPRTYVRRLHLDIKEV